MSNEKARLLDLSTVQLGAGDKQKLKYGCCTNVEIPGSVGDQYYGQYEPLTRKQLLKYEEDIWWKNLRCGLMIGFWASIMLMVLSAVLIAVFQYEHVCVAKKSFLPMPTSTETPVRTAYGLFPVSSMDGIDVTTDPPQTTTPHSSILPFSAWLGP